MPYKLHLAVQYCLAAPQLPRWRLRRWVQKAIDFAMNESPHDALQAVVLGLRFVDAEEMHALNLAWRANDKATNVLSFEYGMDAAGTLSADIAVCLEVLQQEAQAQGKPLLHHAAHLVIHGVLHALGYDHIETQQAERMEDLERRVLASFAIPDPY